MCKSIESSFLAKAFLVQFSEVVGHEVKPPAGWNLGAAGAANAASEPKVDDASLPETVEQLQSLAHQAKKLGFMPNAFVTSKQAKEAQIWQIQSLADDQVELRLMVDGHQAESQSVPVEHFVENWRLHKGKVTCLLPQWHATENPCCPLASPAWAADAIKGAIAIALRLRFETHKDCIQGLELLQNPSGVKVLQTFNKGSLVLVAASQRVEKAKSGTIVPASAFGVGFFAVPEGTALFTVSPHFVPPVSGEANKGGWVAPFWLVETASNGTIANMELRFEVEEVGPFRVHVPVFVNSKALVKGTRLLWNKASKEVPGSDSNKKRKVGA